jgi:hypothetical protein
MCGIILVLVDPVSARELKSQLNGDKPMSTAKALTLCAALLLCTAAEALAHSDRSQGAKGPPKVYATYAHCAPERRIDLSHLQRGELAIMIQDRGLRQDIGLPTDAGECW